jgi:hypothetical protein
MFTAALFKMAQESIYRRTDKERQCFCAMEILHSNVKE